MDGDRETFTKGLTLASLRADGVAAFPTPTDPPLHAPTYFPPHHLSFIGTLHTTIRRAQTLAQGLAGGDYLLGGLRSSHFPCLPLGAPGSSRGAPNPGALRGHPPAMLSCPLGPRPLRLASSWLDGALRGSS